MTIPESVVLIQPYAFDWEKVTVRCAPDSYAHFFAEENEIAFEFVPSYLLGDADGNEIVTITDVTFTQRWLVQVPLPQEIDEAAADADNNGTVDITDATFVQRWLVSIETPYPVGSLKYKYY